MYCPDLVKGIQFGSVRGESGCSSDVMSVWRSASPQPLVAIRQWITAKVSVTRLPSGTSIVLGRASFGVSALGGGYELSRNAILTSLGSGSSLLRTGVPTSGVASSRNSSHSTPSRIRSNPPKITSVSKSCPRRACVFSRPCLAVGPSTSSLSNKKSVRSAVYEHVSANWGLPAIQLAGRPTLRILVR